MKPFFAPPEAPPADTCRPPEASPEGPSRTRGELFDGIARLLASEMPRRDVLKLAAFALVSAGLSGLGIRPAQAGKRCVCRGVPLRSGFACCRGRAYNVTTHCCTRQGVQRKSPIGNLDACPNRVPNPNHTPSVNGCSAPFRRWNRIFHDCCNAHDICYDTCKPPHLTDDQHQDQCDGEFLTCMQRTCRNRFAGADRQQCLTWAGRYFRGVQAFGGRYYRNAQRNACICCPGDEACCPEGRVMCGGTCCEAGEECVDGRCSSGSQGCKTGAACGSHYACPGNAACYCGTTTEGGAACFVDALCSQIQTCSSTADCPAGSICLADNCCNVPKCVSLCSAGSSPAAVPAGKGPTAAGR